MQTNNLMLERYMRDHGKHKKLPKKNTETKRLLIENHQKTNNKMK